MLRGIFNKQAFVKTIFKSLALLSFFSFSFLSCSESRSSKPPPQTKILQSYQDTINDIGDGLYYIPIEPFMMNEDDITARRHAPESIFYKGLESENGLWYVVDHDFELDTSRALETVYFDNGFRLSIIHAGRDSILQVYLFDFQNYQLEKAQVENSKIVSAQFDTLAMLGAEYGITYREVADAVTYNASEIVSPNGAMLEEDYFAKIFKPSEYPNIVGAVFTQRSIERLREITAKPALDGPSKRDTVKLNMNLDQ